MKSLFYDGWRRRRELLEGPVAEAELQLDDRMVSFRSEAPLLIGPLSDSTSRYFFEESSKRRRAIGWLAIDDLIKDKIGGEEFSRAVQSASGIYLRQAWSGSEEECYASALIRALVDRSHNVIAPSRLSTNWSKPLHLSRLASLNLSKCKLPRSNVLSPCRIGSGDQILKNCSSAPTYVELESSVETDIVNEPVLVQERLVGYEVRLHVLDTRFFAVRIHTNKVDYRRDGSVEFSRIPVCVEICEDISRMARSEGLRFCGVDIMIDNKEAVVIEVNPMPGYHTYEKNSGTSRPISDALYETLLGSF